MNIKLLEQYIKLYNQWNVKANWEGLKLFRMLFN